MHLMHVWLDGYTSGLAVTGEDLLQCQTPMLRKNGEGSDLDYKRIVLTTVVGYLVSRVILVRDFNIIPSTEDEY